MSPSPSDASSISSSSSNGSAGKRPIDPILRNALRYTVSAKEYKLLHDYLISRAPAVEKRTPQPKRFEAIVKNGNDHTIATVRASLRVFVTAYTGFKAWDFILRKLEERRRAGTPSPTKVAAPPRHANLRISASFSLILLFHRLLFRFLLRLRASLLESSSSARAFRQRNPRITLTLASRYTPALGASLAGLFLGICPSSQLRLSTAIYVFTRTLEFAYNAAEEKGIWGKHGKPSWVGSWMIMPFACGQLMHAFVFDRECFPQSYGKLILDHSPEYIQSKPPGFPTEKKWPDTFSIVDGLAEISRLHWPPFTSPILFPANKQPLPSTLSNISPVTSSAHPGITYTSCALLHPHDPSCSRTYIKYFLAAFPTTARFFTLLYGAFALLSYRSILSNPSKQLNLLAARILKMSLFVTGTIGTAWGSICLFARYLPRNTLATQRWFLSGFMAGLWAFAARRGERSNFLYSARLSLDSLWKVGVKRGWWKGVRNGDVLVFTLSLALLDAVYEAQPRAVRGAALRKAMGVFRGEGWVDRGVQETGVKDEKEDETPDISNVVPESEEGVREKTD